MCDVNRISRSSCPILLVVISTPELTFFTINKFQTADVGFNAAEPKIERCGATGVDIRRDGHKRYITYIGRDGNFYEVTTRSKSKGDWQTSISYGVSSKWKANEREFWLFVGLEFDPPKFYPMPQWWKKNDVHKAFQVLLKKHGGHRARNDKSTHHAVRLNRIHHWESRRSEMSL